MKSSPKLNIKLIQGLKLLSRNEFNEFIDFCTSGYFSSGRDYSKLLNLLRDLHKKDFSDLNNNSIIELLMLKLMIGKSTLLNRMSELNKILESYIVNSELSRNPFEKNRILMKYFNDRGSNKLFDYLYISSKKEITNEGISTRIFDIEYELSDLSATNNFLRGNKNIFLEFFYKKTEFNIYSFLVKLLMDNIEIIQQRLMSIKNSINISEIILDKFPIDETLESLKKYDLKYYNLIQIIYKMYLSFRDFSEVRHFKSARNRHKLLKSSLSGELNQHIYMLFITYCINQTHYNKPIFYKYLFGIIDEKLKNGYYKELTENNIPVNNFRDYVQIGLKVGKNTWVRSFIQKYSHYLPSEYRQDDVYIAYAMLANNEKKFEEVIKILEKVKKKNYVHYLDSSFYKLRAYFRLKLFDEMFSEIERINKYLKTNDSIPVIFTKSYSKYLIDITMLLKYSDGKIDKYVLKNYSEKRKLNLSLNWIGEEINKIFS